MIINKLSGATTYNIPLCRSCLHGKEELTPMYIVTSTPTVEHSDVIREIDL